MINRNILLFTLISLSPLQLYGMQNSSRQISPMPSFVQHNPTNALPPLKRPSENPIDFTGPEKKAKTDDTRPQELGINSNPVTFTQKPFYLATLNTQIAPIITSAEEEKEQGSQTYPIAIGSQDEDRHIESLDPTLSENIKKTIHNFDSIALGNLLITNEATQLTKEQKEELYTQAKQRRRDLKRLRGVTHAFAKEIEKPEVKDKFSFDPEYQNIQKISRHLYALKTLPKLTFPQYFSPNIPYAPNPSPKTTPDKALLALIKNEQKKILVCCYSFDYMPIAQALVDRKNKKDITIEVITDHQEGNKENRLKVIKLLKENGIEVLAPQNDKWETMHHKFSLFSKNLLDKPLVCEGSFNYTDSATKRNWEFMEISDTPEKIEFFKNEFETVKNRSQEFKITQPMQRNNNNYNNNNYSRRY